MVSCLAADLDQWRQSALAAAAAFDVELAEVDWLLRELAGLDGLTLRLLRSTDPPLELACSLAELDRVWQVRLRERSPIQYCVGQMTWRRFRLRVSPAVLIPRPETELIVEIAQARLAGSVVRRLADIGTGTGAIALGLVDLFPEATVDAVDVSGAALAIARANCDRYPELRSRVRFLEGSWLEPLAGMGLLDGLLSNPPYIPSAMVDELEPEVRDYEPRLALDGGVTGLDGVGRLVMDGAGLLRSGGLWLVEHMLGQSGAIVGLLEADGRYDKIEVHYDWAGCDRFVSAMRR
jgi:release factor glutamine methyltransferase